MHIDLTCAQEKIHELHEPGQRIDVLTLPRGTHSGSALRENHDIFKY